MEMRLVVAYAIIAAIAIALAVGTMVWRSRVLERRRIMRGHSRRA
ncbi:hypothetical protein A6F68_01190 [Tsuneonella dongtanensis]|uniref:Heme exporter protein D n=1 Tax=Tsuneonella dongtanensis TaxID=692370 RepID=A0A1B2AC91_9SPHN|nr:hypothetical protein [Tsuneonella dongtanensis]ANY19708.1 hypothetical protein A6F68_01190 [Tsuneonella dongtanensis]